MSKALERLYAEGKVLSIGVSNWNPVLLQELMSVSHVNPHAVEQMHNIVDQEWGMYHMADKYNIFYYAYGSLRNIHDEYFRRELMSSGDRNIHDTLHKRVVAIAERFGKQPAHVVLKWQLSQGIGVIPRATQQKNLKSNLNELWGWDLTQEDIESLNLGKEEPFSEPFSEPRAEL